MFTFVDVYLLREGGPCREAGSGPPAPWVGGAKIAFERATPALRRYCAEPAGKRGVR